MMHRSGIGKVACQTGQVIQSKIIHSIVVYCDKEAKIYILPVVILKEMLNHGDLVTSNGIILIL
jgi:hypothetical protein